MKYHLLALVLFALLLSTGCTKESLSGEQITGSGKIVSQERSLTGFTGVAVSGIAHVIITQGDNESVRVETDDNIIDRVETSVSASVLNIALEKGSYSGIKVTVYVTMKQITSLTCDGTADFTTTGQIQTDAISIKIRGTGNASLSGTAKTESIDIAGTGNIHGFGLASTDCSVRIAGSGNAEVNVAHQLDVSISGVGNVSYSGDPSIVNKTIAGVGSVTKK